MVCDRPVRFDGSMSSRRCGRRDHFAPVQAGVHIEGRARAGYRWLVLASCPVRWRRRAVPSRRDDGKDAVTEAERLHLRKDTFMHRGYELWNISLKFLCESTQDHAKLGAADA
jgi:hypothetical protein